MVDQTLTNRNILCLTSHDWYAPWNVSQQVMSRLAETNNILYFCFPAGLGKRNNVRKKKHMETEWITPGMAVWNPRLRPLPVYRLPRPLLKICNRLNQLIFKRYFEKKIKELSWKDFIIWVYDPRFIPLMKKFKGDNLLLYDCIDDWAGYFQGSLAGNLEWIDRQAYCTARLVFAGSNSIMNRKYRLHDKFLVPFGVDARHFATSTQSDLPRPADMERITGPVVGLIGVLDKRINIPLLQQMARDKPEWQVVLVGPIFDTCHHLFSEMLDFPNVYFLGAKTLQELPAYLKTFQVCMIPYFIDQFTKSINPLKLYEYFASGKPVVSTPIPECLKFSPLVRIAETPDEFIAQVSDAMAEKDQDRRQARIQIAFNNTWDEHVRKKSQTIMKYL